MSRRISRHLVPTYHRRDECLVEVVLGHRQDLIETAGLVLDLRGQEQAHTCHQIPLDFGDRVEVVVAVCEELCPGDALPRPGKQNKGWLVYFRDLIGNSTSFGVLCHFRHLRGI